MLTYIKDACIAAGKAVKDSCNKAGNWIDEMVQKLKSMNEEEIVTPRDSLLLEAKEEASRKAETKTENIGVAIPKYPDSIFAHVITKEDILDALTQNTKLTEVDFLPVAHLLTDKILKEALAIISETSPKLTTLKLSKCSLLTDSGMIYLDYLKKLENLELESLPLTDAALAYLCDVKSLRNLNLKGCNKITDNGQEYLQSSLKLTNLNLEECLGISAENRRQHLFQPQLPEEEGKEALTIRVQRDYSASPSPSPELQVVSPRSMIPSGILSLPSEPDASISRSSAPMPSPRNQEMFQLLPFPAPAHRQPSN